MDWLTWLPRPSEIESIADRLEAEEVEVLLEKRCFKIDKPNAVAMIHGYQRHGAIVRQYIWCATKDSHLPALVTYNRSRTRFELSDTGVALEAENTLLPFCYAAALDSEYFIRNDFELWKTLCSNGLFDIWNPRAPQDRFDESKANPSRFRIQLLRLYALDRTFRAEEIMPVSSRVDHLLVDGVEVRGIRPVIEDTDFGRMKSLLKTSVSPYLAGWQNRERPPAILRESAHSFLRVGVSPE